ncbi:MAG: ABC transporter permease [Acidobacteria bacterium]|nr:ABC transporter permease [Acidobacteriota bacterium]
MAVYEQTFKPYAGALTPEWSRFLIIPRHALRQVFQSKLLIAFYAACFIYPLVAAILIYLHHNSSAIQMLRIDVRELLPIDGSFFQSFVMSQGWFGFFLTVLVGPPLVSRDLANNALPLYLYRPFSRAEYVLGKMSVLLILLSAVTWIPGLILFFFKAFLDGGAWLTANFWIAGAILIGSAAWILVIALLSLAISAWVKWRVVASAALLGLFFIPSAFGAIVNALFLTRWGSLIMLPKLIGAVWSGLFGSFAIFRRARDVEIRRNGQWQMVELMEPPLWTAWAMLALVCVVCLFLLFRKVRAYEVVRG